MATIAITQAAFAGFGVLRRKPWAPLVWSTVYVVAIAAVVLLLGVALFGAIGRMVRLGSQAAPADMLGLLGAVLGGYFILLLVFWVIGAVVNMAVVRAVLEPESDAFAYMRLGSAELWLMLANLVLFILFTVLSIAVSIPAAIVELALITAWPDGRQFVALPVQLLIWAATLWLMLRFSMAPSLIFADRSFRLFESWTLTRGHVWRLLGVGALVVLTSLGLYIVLAILGFAAAFPMAQSLRVATTTPQAFFTQPPQAIWNELAPFLVLYAVLAYVASTFLLPLFFAPWPEAYRQLTRGDVAATFS